MGDDEYSCLTVPKIIYSQYNCEKNVKVLQYRTEIDFKMIDFKT